MPATLRLRASDPQDIARAANLLRNGGTVAFPTETVYGLGANALSEAAVAQIFAAKQRPSWDPLIVHVPDLAGALRLVQVEGELSRRVDTLAAAFWPGPLTLLLPRRAEVPNAVTAGRPLVGVRVPSAPAALALLRAAGVSVAAPSANRFGHTSPTTAQHVLDDLDGRIDALLDGGATAIGLESTVLDPAQTPMMLYRPGAITPEVLTKVTGVPIQVFQVSTAEVNEQAERTALPAPGVGLRHYAPEARLVLVEGTPDALLAAIESSPTTRERRGVMLPIDWPHRDGWLVEDWGRWGVPQELGTNLFNALRSLDARGAEIIFCPKPAPGGLRDAIRDRLQKAARAK